MRDTLICTVGTSFESNLRNLSPQNENSPTWQKLKQSFEKKAWKALVQDLLTLSPSDRLCGAEINTIEEAKNKNWLNLRNLFFLVSDTDSGRNMGEILKQYFTQRKIEHVDYKVIEKLQDEKPKDFKIYRNY